MTKDELFKAVNNLNCNDYTSSSSWEKRAGFDSCKEQVLKLIIELDVEGMSPRTFELFRNAMNDLTNNYKELFELQKELQLAQQEILSLQKQLIANNKLNNSKIKLRN